MCALHGRGISAAVHGRPASVLVTDLNVETMANMAYNIELNRHRYPAGVEVCCYCYKFSAFAVRFASAKVMHINLAHSPYRFGTQADNKVLVGYLHAPQSICSC